MLRTSRVLLALCALGVPLRSTAQAPLDYPDQYFYDDNEQLLRIEKDKNQDGKIDLWEYYAGDPKPVRVEVDENHDGEVDLWHFFFGPKMVRQEQDTDRNGTIDLWVELDPKGRPATEKRDTTGSGKADFFLFYEHGQKVRIEKEETAQLDFNIPITQPDETAASHSGEGRR